MKKIIAAVFALAFLGAAASAQPGPGPGPPPNPWTVNGSQIYLPGQQCIVMPQAVTGGCKGNNTINAAGLYVNGSPVLTVATGASITINTSTIIGGTPGRVLYDNAGTVGEYTAAQLTAQINAATSSLSGALPAFPGNTTTYFRGDGSYQTLNCAALTTPCLTGNQTITLTGDVTGSGATAITTTLANIPSGVPMAGSIIAANIAAPASPAAAHVSLYADSTDLRFHDKNASGAIGTTVVADTGAANNFLTAISVAGAISKARPTCANLSDSSGGCSMSTTAGGDLSGTLPSPTVAKINGATLGTTTATAGNVLIGSGTQWVTQAITGAVSLTSGGVTALTSSGFANPTANVGLTAVNGSATTAMRSDAAPALSQSISPTWTGSHLFTGAAASTPSNGQATLGASATNGAILQGHGSVNDFQLTNNAGSFVCVSPTGTQTLFCSTLQLSNPLALTYGGANNSLTASNGGIVYSDASKLNILAGTVTASQCLLSGSNAAPSWGSCAGGAAVSSVTANDTTLTISPTTGAVLAQVNLARANTWTAAITDTVAPPQIILGVNTTTGGAIKFFGSTSGNLTLQPAAAAGSSVTLTMPGVTDTIAVLGTNQTHTATQTFSGTLNVSGTFQSSGNTMTFPGSAATLAALTVADQTITGGANVTSLSQSTGNISVDCGARPIQFITNNGAYTITAPSNDGSCLLFVTNGASAGATTFSGFSAGANTGASLTTTNTNKFTISIWRANGTSGYSIYAHQ